MTTAPPTVAAPALRIGDQTFVRAHLTSALDRTFTFEMRLVEARCDGLTGVIDAGTARLLGATNNSPLAPVSPRHASNPFWAEFKLPGENQGFEYVVRLGRCGAAAPGGGVLTHWLLCGGDDPERLRRTSARLSRLIAGRRAAAGAFVPTGGA